MALTQFEAWVFLPFVVPICLYVAFTDMREMRITNQAVLVLFALFLVVGAAVLPFSTYIDRLVQALLVLCAGFVLNAAGLIGAGDAKFAAAAAPFISSADWVLIFTLLAASLLSGWIVHRGARAVGGMQWTPHWKSWSEDRNFPMGYPLAATLLMYLLAAALTGS